VVRAGLRARLVKAFVVLGGVEVARATVAGPGFGDADPACIEVDTVKADGRRLSPAHARVGKEQHQESVFAAGFRQRLDLNLVQVHMFSRDIPWKRNSDRRIVGDPERPYPVVEHALQHDVDLLD
jgi:hypothetical protein